MIYEIRTYTLRVGAVREYEARWAEAYPTRAKYSPVWGFWHTEIGPLNQAIHIWAYESLQQRASIRAAAAQDASGNWPPRAPDTVVSQETDIIVPIPGLTEWEGAHEWGDVYELRMYTYPPGVLARVAEQFSAALEARAALYPVAGIWTSELGNLNRLYQLFPYKDWDHRDQLRAEYRQKGVWPPHADVAPVTQLVRHLIPASFSPLH